MVARSTVDLAFSVHGPADGVPILLLHGFPLARQMWKPQMQALAEAGFRVITPDLRGHGESPVPDRPSTMALCAADAFRVMDGLGLHRFVLVGFSMGGYVALEMMAQNPKRITALSLVSTKAEADAPEAKAKRKATAKTVREQGSAVVAETMLPKFFTESTRRQNGELTDHVLHMVLNTDPVGVANALLGMAARRDHRTLLPKVRVPTLVVVGAHDELTPPSASRAMVGALPQGQLAVIEDAAHLAPLERPNRVNEALVSWLKPNVRNGKRLVRSKA